MSVRIGSLSREELWRRLAGPGLHLRTGAFVVHVRSRLLAVANGLGLLYADFPLATEIGFADFHVSLERPAGVRAWLRPQVIFRIDGHAPFKPLPAAQAFPMMEWGLNWCVSSHAHSYLIIHAAAVERHGRAVVMPAPPGSGKSTLCAALVQRGWRLLSDELTLLRLADGMLVPLPRPVSLKNGSIPVMRAYAPEAVFGTEVADTTKGVIAHMKPPLDSVRRAAEPVAVGCIVFPCWEEGTEAHLAPLSRARGLLRTAENAFNFSLLGARGFDALAAMIDGADCFDLRYGRLDDAVRALSALVPPPELQ